ncbi:MAG: hypothetical protein GX640_23110 [Fibrobacter sp.]|nr:hypothetical protein [Fibrobacter sp.]
MHIIVKNFSNTCLLDKSFETVPVIQTQFEFAKKEALEATGRDWLNVIYGINGQGINLLKTS